MTAGRVVVLGGTGYLGGTIARDLARDRDVVAVSRHASDRVHGRHLTADVTDRAQVRDAVSGARAVICAMGYSAAVRQWRLTDDQREAATVNVDAVASVIEVLERDVAAGGAPALLVLVGSVVVRFDDARQGYAAQKRAAESLVTEAARRGSVRGVTLRLPTVYGASQGATGRGVVAAFGRAALRGDPLLVWEGGAMRRDLLHVEDAARAIAGVVRKDVVPHPVYEVGSGEGIPLRDIAAQVIRAADAVGHTGSTLVSVAAPSYATDSDLTDIVTDPSAFAAEFDWRARWRAGAGIDGVIDALAEAETTTEEKE